MKKRRFVKIFCYCFLLLILSLAAGDSKSRAAGNKEGSSEDQIPRVLFISSYQFSFETVPMEITGIRKAFKDGNVYLDTEFMDTRQLADTENIEKFYRYLKYKLERLPKYDLVILGDDAALMFAMKHQNELFLEIPLVFLGINDKNLAETAAEDHYITGVVETAAYRENIELAGRIMPKAQNIVALVDDTLTGKAERKQFLSYQKQYPQYHFSLLNTSQYTQEELAEKLEGFDESTILFFLTMFEDKDGNAYTIKEGASFIASHARIPVFRLSSGGVGDGLLGGLLVSFDGSGELAADMAKKILNGTPVESIPLETECPKYGYFDEEILKSFDIDKSILPENSIFLHHKPGFWEEFQSVIFSVCIVCIVFLLVIMFLVWDNDRQKHRINQDYLTKLHNRLWMTGRLKKLLAKGQECTVFLLDVDDFKTVNDSLGHALGDELLTQVAERLKIVVSRDILLSRFGGDEFIGLIDTVNKQGVIKAVEEILSIFHQPFYIGKETIRLHASMGISQTPSDSKDAEELIAFADTAMYHVKDRGKNGYGFFNTAMLERIREQEHIANLLRDALDHDGFEMFYQPQFDVDSEKLIGFEALLRLKNGKAGPGEFIPVAEQTGMIIQIGRMATEKVVRQMAAWKEKGYPMVRVAVNFSNIQLRDNSFPDFVNNLLKKWEIMPDYLEIEITESVFLEETDQSVSFMNRLCSNGIPLSLDDFGSGYSAISYLDFMEIRMMKLDKSLLDRYLKNCDTRMIESIVYLAHNLGLTVIAEGVETDGQREMLKKVGCDYVQGYLFGKPSRPETVEQYFLKKEELLTSYLPKPRGVYVE